MTARHRWQGAPARLMLSFALLLLVPAGLIVWLGVRFVEQDRALSERQLRERREAAADRVAAGLQQAVGASERRLAADPPTVPIQSGDDAVLLTLTPNGLEARPGGALLYLPALPEGPPEPTASFALGEALEFRALDYAGAIETYRVLAQSPSSAVRAGALLRLARTLRKAGRADDALRTYASLMEVRDARLSDLPADLVARRARCALLDDLGRARERAAEAQALHADLLKGRWALDEGTFSSYVEQAVTWAGLDASLPPDRLALSTAAARVWSEWMAPGRGELRTAGRRSARFAGVALTLLWQDAGDGVTVLVAGPRFAAREWFAKTEAAVATGGLKVALTDTDGIRVLGELPPAEASVERRLSAVTQVPWTVVVASANESADLEGLAGRRRLILTGVVLLVTMVVAAGYVMLRAVSRELAVARLQSDFVSAVSHEFRTPLTSLRQFTDLLNDDPDQPAAKRRGYYEAQARATERLRRLVESLLDFGRMEAGARPYRLEPVTAEPFVRRVVDEFQREAAPSGFAVELMVNGGGCDLNADPDALSRALWNLLDNAVKYSGTGRTVTVTLESSADRIRIHVRDQGLGIPRHEQDEIFKKFVRGAASQTHGIKGTGIGLAMVRHIVEAHGGRVGVESTLGRGSTFTIELPVAAGVPGDVPDVAAHHEGSEPEEPRCLAS